MHRFLVLLPLLAAFGAASARADELPIFDAHMHYSHDAWTVVPPAQVVDILKKAGVKRVLWVGGAGGLEVKPGVQSVDTPEFPKDWKQGSLATREALNLLRKEPSLDWSFLAPSADLSPGQRTGKFRLGTDQLLKDANGQSRISVEDYAMAMIDEVENPGHIRQRFTVGY